MVAFILPMGEIPIHHADHDARHAGHGVGDMGEIPLIRGREARRRGNGGLGARRRSAGSKGGATGLASREVETRLGQETEKSLGATVSTMREKNPKTAGEA
jgi:hypothetical protein